MSNYSYKITFNLIKEDDLKFFQDPNQVDYNNEMMHLFSRSLEKGHMTINFYSIGWSGFSSHDNHIYYLYNVSEEKLDQVKKLMKELTLDLNTQYWNNFLYRILPLDADKRWIDFYEEYNKKVFDLTSIIQEFDHFSNDNKDDYKEVNFYIVFSDSRGDHFLIFDESFIGLKGVDRYKNLYLKMLKEITN